MLKYEDLMSRPITTLANLYSKLNLDFDVIAADSFYNHTRAIGPSNGSSKYWSTYQTNSDIDIFKWKKELPLGKIRHVEQNCIEFMHKVGYKVLQEGEYRSSELGDKQT